ncbi:autotransporter family protein [Paraburkholderia youngii]|uniref:autotransporter family protein n=1 Tax=Paraburkholderia youngii TaxID=2782701 RepID=UPI00158FD337|nr:autotransporter outer membrane beta-barrel domain-containing protein [Paraburkholderia youngii]NUX59143.1 autotransporter outer membrane beta-barrel domain-containing protein [Paraburkholderia youngii]
MAAGSAQAQVTAVNNHWNGTSSSDWFNASNWIDNGGNHLVPDFRTNTTFINTLTSNRTVIDGLAATSRIVRIGDGASSGSNGSLNIQNGGTLDVLTNSGGGYVAVGYGTPNPSIAALTVTGAGSRLSAAGYMYVALFDANQGTMNVQNGALVEAGVSLDVAGGAGSTGIVNVAAQNSVLRVGNSFFVGDVGRGRLTISNGGAMSSGTGFPPLISGVVTPTDSIGSATGAVGDVTVIGSGSSLSSSNPLIVGGANPALIPFYLESLGLDATVLFMGDGSLTIANGGAVSSGVGPHTVQGFVNNTFIGGTPGSTGRATVTDPGSNWTVGGNLMIGGDGHGTLTIANSGRVSAVSVVLAQTANSTGMLNIGAAAGAAAVAPGVLNTGRVAFGGGTGDIVFNHTDASGNYLFPAAMVGSGAVNVYSGKTVMTGASTYVGPTTVHGGTIAAGANNVFSPNSDYAVQPAGTLDLRGFDQRVAGVVNAGLVRIASDPGTVLTTTHYVGHNGTIALNTYLGGDNSPSDRLAIDGGSATGTSALAITNAGGPGALTTASGIPVVVTTNGGTTDAGAFALGTEVRGGAFDYRLYQGAVGGAFPHDWFLRSDFVVGPGAEEPGIPPGDELPEDPPPPVLPPGEYPIIGPELATYSVVQPLARQLGLTMLGTMHERIGDTLTQDAGGAGSEGLARSAWARVFGQQIDNRYETYTDARAKGQQIGVQAGVDLWRGSFMPGHHDAAGVYFAYGNSNVDVDGLVTNAAATGYVLNRTGSVNLDGYSGGAYWTHYGPGGWYVDAILQGTYYDGNATTQFARLPVSGSGFSASLEVGYPFHLPLGPGFVLEPQAQIIWQHVGLSEANDGLGSVDPGSASGVTGRLGVRGQWTIERANGQVWQPYMRANLWRDWGGRATTTYSGAEQVPITQQFTRMDFAAGVTAKLGQRMSLYGQFGYQFSINDSVSGSRRGVWGDIGARYTW